MPLLHLPTELLMKVFGHLEDDHQALRASALVCRRLQPTCQKPLFFRIGLCCLGWTDRGRLSQHPAKRRADRFLNLVLASPHLALYVIRLDIHLIGWSGYWVEVLPNVITIIGKLTCLRDLRVLRSTGMPRVAWARFPDLLHTTIIKMIQYRSLSRLCVQNISFVPAATFLKSSIQHLSLSSISWEDSPSSKTAPIESSTLKSLDITLRYSQDSLTVIDGLLSQSSPFNSSELQSMRITIQLDILMIHENQLSKFRKLLANVAGTLKHLWLHCDLEADFLDFDSRPYPQLQTIGRRFSIHFTNIGIARLNPVPFLLKTIPNAGSTIAGVGFHLILDLIIFMDDPSALNENLGPWAELAQALTPIPCLLTISISSYYEFRIPDLISRFEDQFQEMRVQRRLTMKNMGFVHAGVHKAPHT